MSPLSAGSVPSTGHQLSSSHPAGARNTPTPRQWYLSLAWSRFVKEKGVRVGLEAIVHLEGAQGLAGVLGAARGVGGRRGGDVTAPAPVPTGGAAAAVRDITALLPGIARRSRGCGEGTCTATVSVGPTEPLRAETSPEAGQPATASIYLFISLKTWQGEASPPLLSASSQLSVIFPSFPLPIFLGTSAIPWAQPAHGEQPAPTRARTFPTAPGCYFYPSGCI